MRKMRPLLMIAALLAVAGSPALAADASGLWLRGDGTAQVRIAPCGTALCGTVAWVKDPARRSGIGRKVFYEMVPDGDNRWSGKAFNPEDGKTYSGKMTLAGSSLTTAGCVLGGLICKSVTWSRVP